MNPYEDRTQWQQLFGKFNDRNRGRRARLETFDRTGVREEMQEAIFQRISVEGSQQADSSPSSARVTIQREDHSTTEPELLETVIERVRRLAPQYDSDGSEQALEIEDEQRVLTILRFESKVDGAS